MKPAFYRIVDILTSKYRWYKAQAIAGVIETDRLMFDQKNWKYRDDSNKGTGIDLTTASSRRSVLKSERAIYALSLASLIEEIMESKDFLITYHNDGSRVQAITTNETHQPSQL